MPKTTKTPVTTSQQAQLSGPTYSPLMEVMKQSMAMGAGMSIGQRVVNGILGPSSSPSQIANQATIKEFYEARVESCKEYRETMDQCMKYSVQDSPCYEELRAYVSCINRVPNETPRLSR